MSGHFGPGESTYSLQVTSITKTCPHLILKEPLSNLITKFRGSTCRMCSYSGKNQWLCLHDGCYFVGCGSKGGDHGTTHSLSKNHAVSVNLHNSQLFCQQCNSEVLLTSLPSSNDMNQYADSFPFYAPDRSIETDERPLGVCGLPNLGNTCYINAALQVISNCPQLTEYFLQCSGIFLANRPSLLSRYRDFLSRVWLPPRSSLVSPLSLVHEVKCLYPVFSGFSQHDSQEFLRVFLSHLHDELNSMLSDPLCQEHPSYPSTPDRPNCVSRLTSHDGQNGDCTRQLSNCPSSDSVAAYSTVPIRTGETSRSIPANHPGRSIITDVFQGRLISAVRCLSCNQVSCREEVFLDLSLSLVRPDVNLSVESYLVTEEIKTSPLSGFHKASESFTHDYHSQPSTSMSPSAANVAKIVPSSVSLLKRSLPDFAAHNSIKPLSGLRSALPFARRFFLQLFGLVAISFAWVIARFAEIQGWFLRPALSLTDCLSDYFSVAELNGENKYYCERCKKHCNGLNQTAVFSLPEVLCLHLKRFRSHSTDTSKITSAVSFPLEGLEMKPYLHPDCSDKVTTYDLVGVICHRGDCGGGHYVACALNWHRNTWFEFDDDRVFQLRPDQVEHLTTEAYVLFYRKTDSALTLIRKEADMLLHQYSSGLLHSTVYISRPWFVRFCTCAEPGPISNSEFLCVHKRIPPHLWANREALVVPIPEDLWLKLIREFGGGPILRDFTVCRICHEGVLTRQHRELMAFDRVFEQCELMSDSCGLYAISTTWFDSWKDFVGGKTFKIPGRIDNNDIVDYGSPSYLYNGPFYSPSSQSSTSKANQPRLKIGSAYNQLFGGCWELLLNIYGGGPTVCIRQPEPTHSSKDWTASIDDDLSDSLSSSTQSLVLQPAFQSVANVNTGELDPILHSRPEHATCLMRNGVASPASTISDSLSTSTTNPLVLNNGDTESGVFSAGLMGSSNFSSGTEPLFHQPNHRAPTSFSADNLASLAKGDWKESAVSLDSNELDEEVPSLNGPHSHSFDQLHDDQSKASLLMAGDSSTYRPEMSKLMCNGVSNRLAVTQNTVMDKPRLPMQI